MPLKGVVESLDSVPEPFRAEYKQGEDKKFYLQTDLQDQLQAVNANKAEILEEKRKLADKMRQYEGIDPEKYKAAEQKLKDIETKELEKKGEFDKLLEQHKKGFTEELGKKDTTIKELSAGLSHELINSRVSSLMATDDEVKGVPDLVLPEVTRQTRVERQGDGSYKVVVLMPDGTTPRLSPDNKGGMMTLKELLVELKSGKYARAFDGSGSSGSGAPANAGGAGGGTSTITARDQFTSDKQKSEWLDKHGLEAFEALPLKSSK